MLEAGYWNRLLLCSNHFCPLQEVTWDQDNKKPGEAFAGDARRNVSKEQNWPSCALLADPLGTEPSLEEML